MNSASSKHCMPETPNISSNGVSFEKKLKKKQNKKKTNVMVDQQCILCGQSGLTQIYHEKNHDR